MKEVPEGGAGAAYIGCVGRFLGAIFGSGSETSGSVAKGALRTGDSMTDARLRSQRFAPLIYRGSVRKRHRSLHARSMEASPLVRPAIPQPLPMA